MKISNNVLEWSSLAVDNFDFTRKIVKNILDEKLLKMLGVCQNWIFGQKFDFSNSVIGFGSILRLDTMYQKMLQILKR